MKLFIQKRLSFIFFFFYLTIGLFQHIKAQISTFLYQLNYRQKKISDKFENITFYLDVKQEESVFRSEQLRRSDSLLMARGFPGAVDMQYNNKQLYVYKNIEENKILKYVFVPFIDSGVYAIPVNEKLDWKISDERKDIEVYKCQKATTEYGGRKWEAWFTNEIPIQEGPYIFHGLPGLIVEINDTNNDYSFQLSQIKKFEWKNLYFATPKKNITWKDYQTLQKDFYSDPLSYINRSDVTSYDESGNIVKTNFKEMVDAIRNRILEKNNPLELNYKIEYNK